MSKKSVSGSNPGLQAQQVFEKNVENAINKMLVSYRILLKKHATLSAQNGFGRHEALQIDAASESLVRI
jgi:hypothetical protein